MDANFDAGSGEYPPDSGSNRHQVEISYGDQIERRRPALARSAYAGILAIVFSFTTAATLSASGADYESLAATAKPVASLNACDVTGLIEGPSITPNETPPPKERAAGSNEVRPASEQPLSERLPSERLSSASTNADLLQVNGSQIPALVPEKLTQAEADQWGQAALGLISYPWPERLPGWEITFHPPKDGLYGLTLVSEKRIEIYLREGESQLLFAHVIAHEIGHAVDVTHNDGPDRRVWSDAREIESAPWWPGDGATDFSTGAGDFAEAFAAWQVGSDHFRSKIADPPTAAQIEILQLLAADRPEIKGFADVASGEELSALDPRC